jgi:hypothetical protein
MESGGIEFQRNDSVVRQTSDSPGAWALFKNSSVQHRGVPGTRIERMAVEVTICRSSEFDTRPRYAGLNAHWPLFPWIDALDGCKGEAAQKVATTAIPLRRKLGRQAGLVALKLGLYALVPVSLIGATALKRIAPGIARRFEGLTRHGKAKTVHLVAEHLLRTILGR